MQRRVLGSERWYVLHMSAEFRVFVQRMHRCCRVSMQQWVYGYTRQCLSELQYWDVQTVPEHHIVHELRRWHILERRRGHDMHDMPEKQQRARPWKHQRLCMCLQRGLHGPEWAPLRGVRRSKV